MSNKKLQEKYGWDIDWVAKVVGSHTNLIDSVYFMEAVIKYQRAANLTPDGLVGRMTFGVMRVRECAPSEKDIDRLADMLTAEAGSKTNDLEAQGIGWTLINRIKRAPKRYGSEVDEIVSGRAYAKRSRVDIDADEKHLKTAKLMLTGQIPDPTKGSTHFFSPRNMPRRGRVYKWEGKEKAKSGSYYYEREDGKIILYRKEDDITIQTSTGGGWHEVRDHHGKKHTVAFPRFALSSGFEYVPINGVRPWFCMFFRHK